MRFGETKQSIGRHLVPKLDPSRKRSKKLSSKVTRVTT